MAEKPNAKAGCGTLFVGALVLTLLGKLCGGGETKTASNDPRTPEKIAEDRAKPPTAKPPEQVATAAIPVPDLPPDGVRRPAIGESRAVFRRAFEKLDIEFKPSPLADGTPRDLGRAADKTLMTTIEAIGYGDTLERASLLFGLDKSNAPSLIQTTACMSIFMRETGWSDGLTWASSAVAKPKGATKIHGKIRYKVDQFLPGMFTLTAEYATK